MAHLQVKNVPDELHESLRELASRTGRTLREVVLGALDRELRRQTFAARLGRRRSVELGAPAARFLAEARSEKEQPPPVTRVAVGESTYRRRGAK